MLKKGDSHRFNFKAGTCKSNPLNFSFSGLKTAVLYAVRDQEIVHKEDVCASFQEAAFKDIILKTKRAALEMNSTTVVFGSGVTNNLTLREQFAAKYPELKTIWPTKDLTVDNATMIAGLGYHLYKRFGPSDLYTLEAKPQIPF